MTGKPDSLGQGDWIVHSYYGIGQIISIETKSIANKDISYFKVRAANSTFFVPVDNAINERIRPISSEYKLKKAIQLIRTEPDELPDFHTERKKVVAELASHTSLSISAQLIRDLTHRKLSGGLSDFEEKILESVEALFTREWGLIQDIPPEKAHQLLMEVLAESREIHR